MTGTATEWVEAFAGRLGLEAPDPTTVDALLDVAGVAAHASERTAAPITCWLIGQAGIGVDEARRIADELAG